MAECFIIGQGGSGNSDYELSFSTDGKFQYPAKVVVPNTVTSLQSGVQGFYQHSEIEEIEFENGSKITTLPSTCFSQCINLEKINIPKSVTKIERQVFVGDTLLQVIVFDEDDEDDERKITMNTDGIFQNCTSLTDLKFKEDSKIKIELNQSSRTLFMGCVKIDDIFFSNFINKVETTTYVGEGIFNGCTGLTKVVCPIIGQSLFTNCTGLEEATILPANLIAYAPNYVFQGCTNLKKVTIKNITGLGSNFFYNCTNLTSVTLSDDINTINGGAFQNCSSLTDLFLPSTITSFNSTNTFVGCTNLTNLTVGIDWNCVTDFSKLTLSENSLKGIFENLKDLTETTGKTLTISLSNYSMATELGYITSSNSKYKGWTIASS